MSTLALQVSRGVAKVCESIIICSWDTELAGWTHICVGSQNHAFFHWILYHPKFQFWDTNYPLYLARVRSLANEQSSSNSMMHPGTTSSLCVLMEGRNILWIPQDYARRSLFMPGCTCGSAWVWYPVSPLEWELGYISFIWLTSEVLSGAKAWECGVEAWEREIECWSVRLTPEPRDLVGMLWLH